MQFNRDGLHILDELVRHQRQGNVVFLCGAGVSVGRYPRAKIDNMAKTTYHISVNQNGEKLEFEFFKGKGESNSDDNNIKKARAEITVALNGKSLSFLLGAGCSSLKDEKEEEKGIPTTKKLANKVSNILGAKRSSLKEEKGIPTMKDLGDEFSKMEGSGNWDKLKKFGIKRKSEEPDFELDLEQLLRQLQAAQALQRECKAVGSCIKEVKEFIFDKVNKDSDKLLNLYKSFYKRIFFRDQTLSRPWVFTTNYDLFNEKALDDLAIPYCNGFSGGLERVFNPATFRLTLARQLDISSGKWDAVENFVYLCKLHGSISWFCDKKQSLYPFRERMPNKDGQDNMDNLMIYPSPAKQEQSLGSPYSDLFREFQGRVVQEQSVLIVIGYSFGDEHINKIIYQALTIPSFRLIIFTNPNQEKEIEKLKSLDDPRIWLIGSDENQEQPAHFFESVINHFLPEEPKSEAEKCIKNVRSVLGNDNDQ